MAVQNVLQLYHQQERIAAVKAHDLLSFCHKIVQVYLHCRNTLLRATQQQCFQLLASQSICRRCSSLVLQVGSNDLTDKNCSVDDFTQSVQRYIEYLKMISDVQCVIVMAALP